jgi:L-serine dehydratase
MVSSVFDLFKLGIGPSSSHTMGPMVAANRFLDLLKASSKKPEVASLTVKLYGSLALTGKGHATDRGVLLGLLGIAPDKLDPHKADAALAEIIASGWLCLDDGHMVPFDLATGIVWAGQERLPQHPNALTFIARNGSGEVLLERSYFSIGGGFVRDEEEIARNAPGESAPDLPYPFESGAELLAMAADAKLSIAELMLANELVRQPPEQVYSRLDIIAEAMDSCIERGLAQEGELPGGLKVRRRALQLHRSIYARLERQLHDPLAAMDFVNLWALAVNEENAAGGKVVTAPTNGAAGIIPAVLRFYERFYQGSTEGKRIFLLTAAAIGALYKRNASISGAEVGCQGEVGVACSMAAAGLCAVLGGSKNQVENAAEIAMEHNLGLTCDPIGGLVQIPCIERNAMGAIKAIDAARLALLGDGQHTVSLDKVIATMKRTGADMKEIYKETSLGGLALDLGVNRVEC